MLLLLVRLTVLVEKTSHRCTLSSIFVCSTTEEQYPHVHLILCVPGLPVEKMLVGPPSPTEEFPSSPGLCHRWLDEVLQLYPSVVDPHHHYFLRTEALEGEDSR